MMRAAAAETVRRSRIKFSLDRRLRCQGRARPAIAILMPISGRLDAPVSYTGMPPERVNEFTAAADSVRRSSAALAEGGRLRHARDRKSTRLNSSHQIISYAVFC